MVNQYVSILKLFFRLEKNAWASYFKWCNYVVCGSLFIEKKVFNLQYTEVWNEVCSDVRYPASITYLCHKYLITTLSRYYTCTHTYQLIYRIYWNFLTPHNWYRHWPRKSHIDQALIFILH